MNAKAVDNNSRAHGISQTDSTAFGALRKALKNTGAPAARQSRRPRHRLGDISVDQRPAEPEARPRNCEAPGTLKCRVSVRRQPHRYTRTPTGTEVRSRPGDSFTFRSATIEPLAESFKGIVPKAVGTSSQCSPCAAKYLIDAGSKGAGSDSLKLFC